MNTIHIIYYALLLTFIHSLDTTQANPDTLANLNNLLHNQISDVNMGLVNNTVKAWVYHGTNGYVQVIRQGNVDFQVSDTWPATTTELKLTAHLILNVVTSVINVLRSFHGKLDSITTTRLTAIQQAIKTHTWDGTALNAEQIFYCEDVQQKTAYFITELFSVGVVNQWDLESYVASVNESLKLIIHEAAIHLIQGQVDMYTKVLNNLSLEERENVLVLIEVGHMPRSGLTHAQAAEMVFQVVYQDTLIIKETSTDTPTHEVGNHILMSEVGRVVFGYFSAMHHDVLSKQAKEYLFKTYGYVVKYPL